MRCLIVANQTLGGEGLDRAVRDCLSRDIDQFYVIVPVTAVEHEAVGWAGGFAVGAATEQARAAVEESARRHERARQEARRRAQSRLLQMIDRIHDAGGQAEGDLGPDDPVEAAKVALQRRSFDEVIVSTLPAGLSRWLKMDLPSRVARMTDAPVTTVEAEADTAAP